MHELLLLVTLGGLLFSSSGRLGIANPFQIYFIIWFSIFFGFYYFKDTFIPVTDEFLAAVFVSQFSVFAVLIIIFISLKRNIVFGDKLLAPVKNHNYILFAQIIATSALPLVYLKAISLSGGINIFEVAGYMRLRGAITQDGLTFGFVSYISVMSNVITSISVYMYFCGQIGIWRIFISIVSGLFYVYIGTARTDVLLILILIAVPLILTKVLGIKGIAMTVGVTLLIFVFFASMTAKGISVDADFADNTVSFIENMRSYTVAPLLAFSKLYEAGSPVDLGQNTFQIIFAIGKFFGLDISIVSSSERAYAFVPDPTNVFTVYEVYFRDFSFIGFAAPTFFILVHWWLYRKAYKFGGLWIFLYSASVYPLLMQFFQDQYFSLLSMWIQIYFWFWLFLHSKINFYSQIGKKHARRSNS